MRAFFLLSLAIAFYVLPAGASRHINPYLYGYKLQEVYGDNSQQILVFSRYNELLFYWGNPEMGYHWIPTTSEKVNIIIFSLDIGDPKNLVVEVNDPRLLKENTLTISFEAMDEYGRYIPPKKSGIRQTDGGQAVIKLKNKRGKDIAAPRSLPRITRHFESNEKLRFVGFPEQMQLGYWFTNAPGDDQAVFVMVPMFNQVANPDDVEVWIKQSGFVTEPTQYKVVKVEFPRDGSAHMKLHLENNLTLVIGAESQLVSQNGKKVDLVSQDTDVDRHTMWQKYRIDLPKLDRQFKSPFDGMTMQASVKNALNIADVISCKKVLEEGP